MIAAAMTVALAAACIFLIARLWIGPTAFDRLIAAQGLFVCVAILAAMQNHVDPRWIDAALAIVLIGAALVAAGLKSVRRQSFRAPLGASDGGAP